MDTQTTEKKFDSWAIVEIMGHVRRAGRVTEETHFGVPLLRIDIPQPASAPKPYLTQYYGGSSLYCVTPCDEAAARAVAAQNQAEPVHRYELPAPVSQTRPPFEIDEEAFMQPERGVVFEDDGVPF